MAPQLLQVTHTWNGQRLDTRHHEIGRVTVGDALGHLWSLLGVPIGWVPGSAARWLPMVPPIWSDVQERPVTDFHVAREDLGGQPTACLFDEWDGQPAVRCPPGWTVLRNGATQDGGVVLFSEGDEIVASCGAHVFKARLVNRAGQIPAAPMAPDLRTTGLVSLVGMAAAVAFGVFASHSGAKALVEALPEAPTRMAQLRLPPPPTPAPTPEKRNTAAGGGGAAGSAQGSSGPGGPESGSPGLLDAIGDFGASGGMQDAGATIGTLNPNAGVAPGQTSAGGTGVHGGGGGIGTIEMGTGDGPSTAGDGDGLGPKRTGQFAGGGKGVVLLGSLRADQVQEVVQRRFSAIRYCYQRALPRVPNLAGKINVAFTISGDGTVSRAKVRKSTLGNDEVEQCVLRQFYTMRFPEPSGHGMVSVNYPFVFAPG